MLNNNLSSNAAKKIFSFVKRGGSYIYRRYMELLHPYLRRIFLPIYRNNIHPFYKNKFLPYAEKELLPKWNTYLKPFMQNIDNKIDELVTSGYSHFDNWNNSRRVMFLVASSAALLLIGLMFYILPEYNSFKLNEIKTKGVKRSLVSLAREEKAFLADISDNPNKSLQDSINEIEKKIQIEVAKIEEFTKNQLETPRMVQIIKSKVAQNEILKLFRIASLSRYRATPLTLGATKIGLDKLPEIYIHPIELDIDGDYINVYKFLTSLENSWRIYWNSLEYLVDNYPTAKVSIRVHLLVLSKASDG
ncbi:MAG: hypothetical protein HRT87_02235 [Legionellales bacterium]|nr:hypothetical protein [Legionellales bacterium]